MEQALPGDEMVIRADDWNRVRQAIPKVGLQANLSGAALLSSQIFYAKVSSPGITARSGTTLGTGEVVIYAPDDTNALTATDRTVVVNSGFEHAIATDKYVIIGREAIRRTYAVISDLESPIIDLRLNGSELQYKKGDTWTTWHTGTDCPEAS